MPQERVPQVYKWVCDALGARTLHVGSKKLGSSEVGDNSCSDVFLATVTGSSTVALR